MFGAGIAVTLLMLIGVAFHGPVMALNPWANVIWSIPFGVAAGAIFVTRTRATTQIAWRCMLIIALSACWIALWAGVLLGATTLIVTVPIIFLLRYTAIKQKVILYTQADYAKAFAGKNNVDNAGKSKAA